MHASNGGYCDCGDEEAWTRGAWCRIHGGTEAVKENKQNFLTVEKEQQLEIERIQSRVETLPADLVARVAYLLLPLISSCSLVLFELIQVSTDSFSSFLPWVLGFNLPCSNTNVASSLTASADSCRCYTTCNLFHLNFPIIYV